MKRWLRGIPREARVGAVSWVTVWGLFGCAGGDPVVLSVGPKSMTVSQFEESFWEASARDSTLGPDLSGLQKHAETRARDMLIQILAEEAEPELDAVRLDRLEGHVEKLIVDHLRDVAYGDAYEVTEKDLQRAYEMLGTRRHVRVIQLSAEADAREIQRALREGANFIKVAEQRSTDPRTKASGGDLGWLVYTDLDPGDRDEVFSLQPGERTGVLPHGDEFVIYQVDEVEPNLSRGTLEEERAALEQGVVYRRVTQARSEYQQGLFDRYHYQINPAEVAWLTVLMREKTAGALRGSAAVAQATQKNGMLMTPNTGLPWEGVPVAVADTGRVVATFDPPDGRVPPIWVFDQLLSKAMPTWPLFNTTADVENLIRELVLERLEIREAKARGYDELPAIQYKVQLREDEIRQRQYLFNHFRVPLRPDSAEVRAEYERRIAEFTQPESRVFVAVNVNNLAAAEEAADMLRRNIPIAQIEKAFTPSDSFHATPESGTPPMKRGDSPMLDDVLFSLELGEVSDPVPVGVSFTVAKPVKIDPPKVVPLEEVRQTILSQIVDIREAKGVEAAVAEARQKYPVTIDPSALSKVRPRRPS